MRSFARFAAFSTAVLITASLCACNVPSETTASSESSAVSSSQTASVTETTAQTASETTAVTTAETTQTASSETTTDNPTETQPKLNTANGKFNYVLKNKSWKYDGEMYYHKYKDGTTVYYDKEAKSYFLVDGKGQGWYYDPDVKDFVKDE